MSGFAGQSIDHARAMAGKEGVTAGAWRALNQRAEAATTKAVQNAHRCQPSQLRAAAAPRVSCPAITASFGGALAWS